MVQARRRFPWGPRCAGPDRATATLRVTFVTSPAASCPPGASSSRSLGDVPDHGECRSLGPASPRRQTSEFVSAGGRLVESTTRRPRHATDPCDHGRVRLSTNVLAPSPKTKRTPCADLLRGSGPARAANLANYRLVTAGRDKKFGTKDDKIVALRSASYNPTTHTVTLLPRKKLTLGVKYRITVNGTSATGSMTSPATCLTATATATPPGTMSRSVKLVKAARKPDVDLEGHSRPAARRPPSRRDDVPRRRRWTG